MLSEINNAAAVIKTAAVIYCIAPAWTIICGFKTIVGNAFDAFQISSMEHPVEAGAIVTSIAMDTGYFIQDITTQYAQPRSA